MKTRVAGALVASAAAVAMMGAPAFASVHDGAPGYKIRNVSVLSGNRVNIPIALPIAICGNAIAILGLAEASCQGGARAFQGGLNSGW